MTEPPGDATVIVVGYLDRDSLPACVEALASDPAANRIVVVDNGSNDGTIGIFDDLRAMDPRVETVRNEENLGYAGGVDTVLPTVSTRYVAVLNADCVPTPGWLEPQIRHLDEHPEVAATCPTVTLAGTGSLNAAGQDVHVTGLGFNRMLHRPVADAGHTPVEVPGVQGTAFVARRAALEAMEGWYSGGFLYHEDVELSWTLRLMGWRISYVPTPPVEHRYALTMSPEKLFLLERNRWEMLLANTRLATRVALSPILIWTELMMWAYCATRGRAMLGAKRATYTSIRERRAVISRRRATITRIRRVPDRAVLQALRWNYTWDQLVFLGKRRSTRGRRGGRDLPTG